MAFFASQAWPIAREASARRTGVAAGSLIRRTPSARAPISRSSAVILCRNESASLTQRAAAVPGDGIRIDSVIASVLSLAKQRKRVEQLTIRRQRALEIAGDRRHARQRDEGVRRARSQRRGAGNRAERRPRVVQLPRRPLRVAQVELQPLRDRQVRRRAGPLDPAATPPARTACSRTPPCRRIEEGRPSASSRRPFVRHRPAAPP